MPLVDKKTPEVLRGKEIIPMDNCFTVMERFAPEAVEIIENRYKILRQIMHYQPIGRRQLCKELGFSERLVRSEIDILKTRGMITSTPSGINIDVAGEDMLQELEKIVPYLFNIHQLGEQLKHKFALQEVIIVPGDSYTDYLAKKDLGRAAAGYLKKILYPGCILAVAGGSTLAEMAAAINDGVHLQSITVVPARGGLGEEMEQQAGSIAATIAKTFRASYRLLHIPDNLDEGTAEILKKDSHIEHIVQMIKSADILVHGIGPAMEMANRRGLTEEAIRYLREKQAVGEAFRYYFDEQGNIVYEVPGIGMELGDLANIKTVVAVAGGRHKARAIEAVLANGQQHVLVTDEGAAREILDILQKKKG